MRAPVVILTAGRGSRMGAFAEVINKALLPLEGKAIITHIIEEFPEDTEFVVALGHEGQQVRDYLSMAHPNLGVSYVEVENYDGKGSGPGRSLLYCKDHLQRPFYFVACDTIFKMKDYSFSEPDPEWDWIGVGDIKGDPTAYCNVGMRKNEVVSIQDKAYCENNFKAFIGLMYIYHHELFWESLQSPDLVATEHQISNGLRGLLGTPGLQGKPVRWTDVGDFNRYKAAVDSSVGYDFSKTNEFLYFVGDRVIKFFSDPEIVQKRVHRADLMANVFPSIISHTEQLYCYSYVKGQTLYEYSTLNIFDRVLHWLKDNVWIDRDIPPEKMREACFKFYRDKTFSRLVGFHQKYPGFWPPAKVNGEPVKSVSGLLERVNWEDLAMGVPTFIHGDLHFDHIVNTKAGGFCLLDWRQDFGGEESFGDIYYDLAKMLGGLMLNYDYIRDGYLSVDTKGDEMIISLARRDMYDQYIRHLERFVTDELELSFGKVKLLVGLIYLNMAPLHHNPFSEALYGLGAKILTREVI